METLNRATRGNLGVNRPPWEVVGRTGSQIRVGPVRGGVGGRCGASLQFPDPERVQDFWKNYANKGGWGEGI